MSRIIISSVPVVALLPLSRIFAQAVEEHFSYFPEPVRKRIIKDHTVLKLLRAKIDRRRVILIARSGRDIIGYAIGAAPSSGPAQLFWLYVHPEYRGENTGLSLLSRTLRHLSAKGASSVSISTHTHRAYYERQGFEFVEQAIVNNVEMDVLQFRFKEVS